MTIYLFQSEMSLKGINFEQVQDISPWYTLINIVLFHVFIIN